jgi:hypothetical protein
MFFLHYGKRQIQDIFVTCTYEGVRELDGRNTAYIALSGVVKGRAPRAQGRFLFGWKFKVGKAGGYLSCPT